MPHAKRVAHRSMRAIAVSVAITGTLAFLPGETAHAEDLDRCQTTGSTLEPSSYADINRAVSKGDLDRALRMLTPLLEQAPADLRALYLKAQIEQRSGKTTTAITTARVALSQDPKCTPVVLLLGSLLESAKRSDEALTLYQQTVNQSPEAVDVRRILGERLVAKGQLDAAEVQLRAVREALLADAKAQAAWAEVQGWRGQSKSSVEGFEAALRIDAAALTPERRRTYAEALRAVGRPQDALEQCDLALKVQPREPGLIQTRGLALLDLKRYGEAVKAFEAVIKAQPTNHFAHASLARTYTAMDQRRQARVSYLEALRIKPQDDALRIEVAQVISSLPEARNEAVDLLKPLASRPNPDLNHLQALAEILSWQPPRRYEALDVAEQILERNKDFQKARELYRQTVLWISPEPKLVPRAERALQLFPEDPALVMHLASSLAQDRSTSVRAANMFDEVLRLNPNNGEARIARAELMVKQDPSNAKSLGEELKQGAAQVPDRPDLQARAGNALIKLGMASEAQVCFARGLAKDPSHEGCLTGQIEALVALSRYEDALRQVDIALSKAPAGSDKSQLQAQRREYQYALERARAEALVRDGNLKDAETVWRSLLKSRPEDANGWTALGGILSTQKRFAEALGCFDKALAISPSLSGALQGKIGALIALDRPEEALESLARAKKAGSSPTLEAQEKAVLYQVRVRAARRDLDAGRRSAALKSLEQLFAENDQDVAIALLLGKLYLEDKRYAESADAYRRANRLAPEETAALQGLTSALWGKGERIEALATLKVLRTKARPAERKGLDEQLIGWEVTLAEEEKKAGNFQRALEHYRDAYRLDPEKDYVLKGLAGLYWANGQLELASKFYGIAAVKRPDDLDALQGVSETLLARDLPKLVLKLLENHPRRNAPQLKSVLERAQLQKDMLAVEQAWQRGETAFAESITRDISARYPRNTDAWMTLARLAGQSGDHKAALRWYYRALEIDPDSQPALLSLIATLQALGRYPESGDLIRQMRSRDAMLGRFTPDLDPLEAASWAARASYLQKRNEREAALDAYRRALELGLDAGWLLQNVARLYAENQQPEQALKFYEVAMNREGDTRDAIRGRAGLLLSLGRYQEAAGFVEGLNQHPDATRTDRVLRAELLKQQGDLDEALALYRALYDENPKDVALARGLVGVILASGRSWEALDLLNTLLVERPLDRELLMSTVAALRGLYASDMAVAVLRKVRKYWPSPEVELAIQETMLASLVEAAEAAKERDDFRRARQLYDEALLQSPGNADVLRGYAGLEARSGDHAAAVKRFREALRIAPDDGIAIAGHASSLAATGNYYAALAELEDAWSRTRAPRVGVEWVRLLRSRNRLMEAERVLRELETELGYSLDSTEEELDALKVQPRSLTRMLEALSRFEQIWPQVARRVPRVKGPTTFKPLPELKWQVVQGVKRSEGSSKEAPSPESSAQGLDQGSRDRAVPVRGGLATDGSGESVPYIVLPARKDLDSGSKELADLAPEIAVPLGMKDLEQLATPRTPQPSGRVDLWLVDKLLNEYRVTPIRDGGLGEQDEQQVISRDVINPWASSYQEEESNERSTEVGDDMGDYAFYRPLVSRGKVYNRFVPAQWDPVAEALTLRSTIDAQRGHRLHLGGWLNARTGSPGTTQCFSAFADLRLGLALPSLQALVLEPYVQPGMVTNGADFQNGTMVGMAFETRPGRFEVSGNVGTSPIGFVGGTAINGQFRLDIDATDQIKLTGEGVIEPVMDSLLSWAGQESETTNQVFGFVNRTRGGGSLSLMLDANTVLVLGGDVARYQGLRMPENRWRQGRMLLTHDFRSDERNVFQVRVKATAFGFERQLDGFVLGEGGYFSPLLFLVATGGGEYKGTTENDRTGYVIGLDVGAQYVEGEETDTLTPGIRPVISAGIEGYFVVSPGLELGARYEFDNVGADYTRNTFWVHLTRRFGEGRRDARR